MSDQIKIQINNMNFFYEDKQVVFDLNLNVRANEVLSIFGPAGSGITTVLRSLNRLTELTPIAKMEGEVLVDGKNIWDEDVNVTELRRRIGMVFDVPTPLPMSIFDNIAYGPRLKGEKNKSVLADLVERTLKEAALWDDVCNRLKTSALALSGGQQQRLCIARVLALDPEVILLDRPCSGLDPISTAKIEDSLTALKERFTIILAPHNTQQAGRVSDKVAFMLGGQLIEEGDAEAVFSQPKDKRTDDYITGRFG
ncbi:MAG: phosphate ABC transporter ATP-binding protein [Oscillospiraceae bacterium]|nr:phosphate ABC transporter ATP-binding protein [Oscillospiraceae bacterium]